MTINLLNSAGNLYCYRHDGQQAGTDSWTGKFQVGDGGWEQYVSVFAAGNNFIYAIDPDGKLYCYQHNGQPDGKVRGSDRHQVGDGGWRQYVSVFASGNNFIYAIAHDGNLYCYQHKVQPDGKVLGSDKKLVSQGGWEKYVSVFASGNYLYAIDPSGLLHWRRHDGQQDGTDRWSEWKIVAGGWAGYVCSFAAGDIIYGITGDGNLFWHRHDGQQNGDSIIGAARKLVGDRGWLMYRSVFAANNGIVYGAGVDTMSWMSMIPSVRKLNEITIPGTHDTGTWTLSKTVAGVTNNAKCQSLTLKQQMDAGIRFIDIRVVQDTRNGNPDFQIYHGSENTGLWFSTDIVDVCKKFLSDHPTETIIMSVKDESGSTNNFETHLKLYLTADICFSNPAVPALWEARGRIVLFRRYEFETTGTPATLGIPARKDWPDDERGFQINTGHNILNIQDVYGFGFLWQNVFNDQNKRDKLAKKWGFVKQHLEGAANETNRNVWWINFASASGPPTILNPVDFARGNWGQTGVNSEMNAFLATRPVGHFGTVTMDFPEFPNDGELIKRLIRTNIHR